MKKIVKTLCALGLAAAFLCGCAPSGGDIGKKPDGGEPPAEQPLRDAEEVYASLSGEDRTCGSFDLKKYMMPYWSSQAIYNESVLPYRDASGSVPDRALSYPIAKILEVRGNDLQTLYEEGKDYAVTADGSLSFPASTTVPVAPYDSIYSSEPWGASGFSSIKEKKYIATGKAVIQKQIYVSYIRTEKFQSDLTPRFADAALAGTVSKLKAKSKINIVFYGDSITTGASSTGHTEIGLPPHTPIFSKLTELKLKEVYGYEDVRVSNRATGGWTSADGVKNISRVLSEKPDLVVLAFGMNDGGGQKTDAAKNRFYANYIQMMEKIWQMYPQCEFLLVTSILPNPDALDQEGNRTLSNHEDFLGVAKTLCEEYDNEKVAVCDVMSIHKAWLERKLFMDMGDNYNHPADFAARLYAQAIVASLYENYAG